MFVFYDWPFAHMCTLQRMQPISLLILGSVFSDYVVFYGDYSERETLQMSGIGFVLDRFPFRALTPTKDNNSLATPFTDLWGKGYCDCFLPAHCSPVQVKSHEVGLLSFMAWKVMRIFDMNDHKMGVHTGTWETEPVSLIHTEPFCGHYAGQPVLALIACSLSYELEDICCEQQDRYKLNCIWLYQELQVVECSF